MSSPCADLSDPEMELPHQPPTLGKVSLPDFVHDLVPDCRPLNTPNTRKEFPEETSALFAVHPILFPFYHATSGSVNFPGNAVFRKISLRSGSRWADD